MQQSIFVVVEHFAGRIKSVTHELVSCAKKLQREPTSAVAAVILDENPTELAREMADSSGLDVIAVRVPGLTSYNGEVYTHVLADLLAPFESTFVCVAHSSQGLDFAPALAVELNAACITGVEDIIAENHLICFARSIFGAKAVAHIQSQCDRCVLAIQPGIFRPPQPDKAGGGRVTLETFDYESVKTRSMGVIQAETDTAAGITEAGVVVSAGQGVGGAENIELVRDLAALFAKSAVGGSRIVCDSGWLDYRCQVGVTGATVAPKLYIACGISGAVQHVVGMRNSEFIVAINKDPSAPIFKVADVCVVEDLTTFIPAFIEAFQSQP